MDLYIKRKSEWGDRMELATPAEITQAYADLARTTPPTVQEVGPDEWCLVLEGECWVARYGLTTRVYWHDQPSGDLTYWLPMPPKPRGGEDETE